MTARRATDSPSAASSATAGYSGKPLAQKLGVRAGIRVSALQAPQHYQRILAPPPGVVVSPRLSRRADLVHLFVTERRDLERRMPSLANALRDDAALWVSWPKKASGVATDLSGDVLRAVILPFGLVDVKVCAVDPTWSGLKFVRRLHQRVPRRASAPQDPEPRGERAPGHPVRASK